MKKNCFLLFLFLFFFYQYLTFFSSIHDSLPIMSIYTHNYQFISQNLPQSNCLSTLNRLNKEKQVAMHVPA